MAITRIEQKPCATEDCPGSCEDHYTTDSNGYEYKVYGFSCPQCGAGPAW